MKRFLSISLLIIFTTSTVGVVASSYTCKMMEMKMASCCNKESKGCCEREVKLLKLKDDFVSTSSFSLQKYFSAPLILSEPPVSKDISSRTLFVYSTTNISPPGESQDRLAFIQSFLI
jgi:hypothetical protein